MLSRPFAAPRFWIARCLTYGLLALFSTTASPLRAESDDAPIVIVVLGDSLTAGYGLAEGEGLVPQLQDWLIAKGAEVDLRNAGVSGDTTGAGRERLDWALEPGAEALIVELGANDLLRGRPPEEAEANLDAILTEAKARGLPVLLVGLQAPPNWGVGYKEAFDALYPRLATKHGALLMPNFFEGLGGNPTEALPLMQADGIHPNVEGVQKIVTALGPYVQELAKKAAAQR